MPEIGTTHVVIDPNGLVWGRDEPALAELLLRPVVSEEVLDFVVCNLGYLDLRVGKNSARVHMRKTRVTPEAVWTLTRYLLMLGIGRALVTDPDEELSHIVPTKRLGTTVAGVAKAVA